MFVCVSVSVCVCVLVHVCVNHLSTPLKGGKVQVSSSSLYIALSQTLWVTSGGMKLSTINVLHVEKTQCVCKWVGWAFMCV